MTILGLELLPGRDDARMVVAEGDRAEATDERATVGAAPKVSF